jgi:hypothetical protein
VQYEIVPFKMIPYINFFFHFFSKRKNTQQGNMRLFKKRKKKDLSPNKRHPKAHNAQWGALRGEIK